MLFKGYFYFDKMDFGLGSLPIPVVFLPVLLLFILLVYLLDINYYVRMIFTIINGMHFVKPINFLGESVVYGWVLPFDADNQLTHMNNARVLREYDFGRVDFWTRSGLFNNVVKDLLAGKGFKVLAVANTVRYRRPLYMFVRYKLVTKAVYWDGKILYNEHAMYTKDGIMRNVGYTKAIFPFSVDEFVQLNHPNVDKPKIPSDLELWIRFNEANGLKHRTKKRKLSDMNRTDADNECKDLFSGSD